MRAFSAADSVSLAVDRTRTFLFRPFRWGTFLKLGLVAIVTEGLSSNPSSKSSNNQPSGHGPVINSLADIPHQWIVAGVAAVLLAIVVAMFVAWLITRLRFAYFHCLVNNTTEIRPGWYLLRDQATRFFWLNVVVGLCFLLAVGVISIPFLSGFVKLFQTMPPGGHPDIPLLLSLVLPLIPIILLLVLACYLADVVLRDWMLPHYALEDATAGEAWSQVWASITAEKAQFLAYALLRLVLPTIALIALFVVLILPGLALAGAMGAIGYGIHSAFADAAGAARIVEIALLAFFGALAAGFAILVSICLGGPLSTGLREYALVFYGGRYPALGDLLYPPPPVAEPGPTA